MPVHPGHEPLFIKKIEAETAVTDDHGLFDGLERLVAHTTDDTPAGFDIQ